jgi:hypothetical protein
VLWGWIGQTLPEEYVVDLEELKSQITNSELDELLDQSEIAALQDRIDVLIAENEMPSPSPHWPAVPWPVF